MDMGAVPISSTTRGALVLCKVIRKDSTTGLNPAVRFGRAAYARLTQLGECLPYKQDAGGSSPSPSTYPPKGAIQSDQPVKT